MIIFDINLSSDSNSFSYSNKDTYENLMSCALFSTHFNNGPPN